MDSDWNDFISDVYEAAYRPEYWDIVLKRLAQKINAKSAGLFLIDHVENTNNIIGSHGIANLSKLSYRFGLGRLDHAYNVMIEQDVGDCIPIIEKDVAKREHPLYYRLLLKPNNVGYVAGLNIVKDEECYVGLGIHRSMQAEQFSDREFTFMKALYPHLKRAMAIYLTIHRLKAQNEVLRKVIDQFAVGLVILGTERKIYYVNPAVVMMAEKSGTFSIDDGQLSVVSGTENAQLSGLIDACFQQSVVDNPPGARTMMITNKNGAPPLMVMVSSLDDVPKEIQRNIPTHAIALYFSDPESVVSMSITSLTDAYGLTNAEANLVIGLVNGLSLEGIAERNHSSVHTLRNHLRKVYEKMGVNRQQDIIRLCLNSSLAFNRVQE